MSDYAIREVSAGDVVACHAIEQRCFRPEEAASLKVMQQRAACFPEGFLVAEKDEQIIGFLNSGATHDEDLSNDRLKSCDSHDGTGPNLVVFSVAVHPDSQGLGVAARLLRDFLHRARLLEKKAVMLLCQPELVPYYARFGFRHLGPSGSRHGGVAWHEMKIEF